jgi:hypothetical protein
MNKETNYQKIVDKVIKNTSNDKITEIKKFLDGAFDLMSMGVSVEKLESMLKLIEKHDPNKIIDKDGKIINEKFFEELDTLIKKT